MADFLRKVHGGQAAAGSELVVEVGPHDEAPTVGSAGAAAPIARVKGQVRTADAARSLAKLPRGSCFAPRRLVCHPKFKPHNQRRLAWIRKRRSELHAMSGGVSSGAGAYIVSAGWLFAAGEFAAELAAETGDLEAFKVAAQLTQTGRQHDLAAYSLCLREREARPDPDEVERERKRAEFRRKQAEGKP